MKKKKLRLGDNLNVNGVLCYVVFVNHNDYWVSPVNDNMSLGLIKGCTFAKVSSKGKVTLL